MNIHKRKWNILKKLRRKIKPNPHDITHIDLIEGASYRTASECYEEILAILNCDLVNNLEK